MVFLINSFRGILVFFVFSLINPFMPLKPPQENPFFFESFIHAIYAQSLPSQALNLTASHRQRIEQALTSTGHFHGEVDGVFNHQTLEAIRNWQQERGEASSGILTLDQALQLFELLNIETERALNRLGYPPGEIDGIFDSNAQAAIRRWQKDKGKTETGELTIDQIAELFLSLEEKIQNDERSLNLNHEDRIRVLLALSKEGFLHLFYRDIIKDSTFDQSTRNAIKAWQQIHQQGATTGYLTFDQAQTLILSGESMAKRARFQRITKGWFFMGSPESERGRGNDETRHQVFFTKDFEIQVTELTQSQWFFVMGDNPSFFQYESNCPQEHLVINGVSLCPNHPVESVSWNQVQYFISLWNRKKRDGYSYSLPTEAQWECAARGGTSTPYFFGDNNTRHLSRYAWHKRNTSSTQPVETLKANPFNVYDMYGNVQEMVQDFYNPYYLSSSFLGISLESTREDPLVDEDPHYSYCQSCRVMRGGHWNLRSKRHFRSASRAAIQSDLSKNFLGFRLARMRNN